MVIILVLSTISIKVCGSFLYKVCLLELNETGSGGMQHVDMV